MTKDEFAARAEELRETMYRVSAAYLSRECDRADAAQEALLKAWKKLPSLREEAFFGTWLIRILIRECIGILRKQKHETPTDAPPEREAPYGGGDIDLKNAILSLPDALRITLVLHYMEGMATGDIAKALRVPKGTVCARLKRARDKIKEIIGEDAV